MAVQPNRELHTLLLVTQNRKYNFIGMQQCMYYGRINCKCVGGCLGDKSCLVYGRLNCHATQMHNVNQLAVLCCSIFAAHPMATDDLLIKLHATHKDGYLMQLPAEHHQHLILSCRSQKAGITVPVNKHIMNYIHNSLIDTML